MDAELKLGLKANKKLIVLKEYTAKHLGSGALEVFSTPAMVALMEGTAMEAVQSFLPEGYGTVGTALNIQHIAATPLNMTVTATAELIDVNGKRLKFKVEVFDEKEQIGTGLHERYIVEEARFLSKVTSKSSPQ